MAYVETRPIAPVSSSDSAVVDSSEANIDRYRVAPRVPLAVLPGPEFRVMPWRRTAATGPHAKAALDAVDQLIAAARHADRHRLQEALSAGVTALGAFAKELSRTGSVTLGDDVAPGKLIHQYFGVRHSDSMSATTMNMYTVLVARWCIAEMKYAAMDANDILFELVGWRTALAGMAEAQSMAADGVPSDSAALQHSLNYLPDGDPWDRWIVAHHAYLLFNMLAAEAIRAANESVTAMRDDLAAAQLRTAEAYVRGITSSMIHSAVLPGRMYLDEIRPSMTPPHLPRPLTGAMFTEHRIYHQRMGEMLTLLHQPHTELNARSPELAFARDNLLNADVIDLERHITMGEQLIRDDQSLVQRDMTDNAVAELRRMRARRIERYRPFMRYGAEQA